MTARPASLRAPTPATLPCAPTTTPITASSAVSAGDSSINFDYSAIQRDAAGRITGYSDSFSNSIAYKYDAAGQLTSLTLPGGKTVTLSVRPPPPPQRGQRLGRQHAPSTAMTRPATRSA